MKIRTLIIFFFFSLSLQAQQAISAKKGLKDYFSEQFSIGVAVSPRSLASDETALILREFNSLTAENAMKMERIHPKEDEYNWRAADSIADFARANKLKLRGHTLVWHRQAPNWMFIGKDGKEVTKELLLERLKNHITTVVTRYKDVVYAWDVANEVISDESDEYFRNSKWYKICGEEFIEKAFQWAHEADPNALLFYNDYNETSPEKRAKIIKLIRGLQNKGIPINGIGLQAHYSIGYPTEDALLNTLKDLSSLGLDMQITELDISVYTGPDNTQMASGPYTFTAEQESKQIEMYTRCFRLFKQFSHSISSVTFWNVSDRHSWLDNFPVRNRKNFPLLFDQKLNPKKVYFEVLKIADAK